VFLADSIAHHSTYALLDPGGVWWLDSAATSHDVVYGNSFILQRVKVGGPGLVPQR
jgi:hypothetical protein